MRCSPRHGLLGLLCASVVAVGSAAAAPPPAFKPTGAADLRWIAAIFDELPQKDGFDRVARFLGSAPRAHGGFTELTPHAPLFAAVLVRDERHATGARTQTIRVRFAGGKQPAVATLERRFGKARRTPPMADRMGQNVSWTKIIHLAPPRIRRGSGRIVIRLAGGADAARASELVLDLYLPGP